MKDELIAHHCCHLLFLHTCRGVHGVSCEQDLVWLTMNDVKIIHNTRQLKSNITWKRKSIATAYWPCAGHLNLQLSKFHWVLLVLLVRLQ